jgi:hypothetical protein
MDRRVSRKLGPFGDGFMKQKGSNPGSIVGIARASEIRGEILDDEVEKGSELGVSGAFG